MTEAEKARERLEPINGAISQLSQIRALSAPAADLRKSHTKPENGREGSDMISSSIS